MVLPSGLKSTDLAMVGSTKRTTSGASELAETCLKVGVIRSRLVLIRCDGAITLVLVPNVYVSSLEVTPDKGNGRQQSLTTDLYRPWRTMHSIALLPISGPLFH
jgi:hypothetical protein